MAGIYFHIPFCKSICGYCDFHRTADVRRLPATVQAMHDELDRTTDFLRDRTIRTIYFGGGTPSLLHPRSIGELIGHAAKLYDCTHVAETTVEVNPDDITPEYIRALRTTTVDRISIGIQSFDDRQLRFMNRRHTGEQAKRAVRELQAAGYGNITADLIFGTEGFGADVLADDLQTILELGIGHVSAYHLTIEPATRFGRMAARGEMRQIDEELSERLFLQIHDTLTAAGFEHYEVSNYARHGFRSRHNSSYWDGTEYLGIGPGAHSYNGRTRRWCSQSPHEYAAGCAYESEELTRRDRLNEMIMTSLRRAEGLDLRLAERMFGERTAANLAQTARAMSSDGAVVVDGERIRIPAAKMLASDAVIARLFDAED